MKLPAIPLPEPAFTITITRGSARSLRAEMAALRFLLWLAPAAVVDYALATVDGGRHALWLTLAATKLGLETRLAPTDIDVTLDYIPPGYGKLTPACFDAISLLARTEGILLDPVYTGKAMCALLDDVRRGRLTSKDHVVFVHTGGTPALFAYGREVAEQLSRHPNAATTGPSFN